MGEGLPLRADRCWGRLPLSERQQCLGCMVCAEPSAPPCTLLGMRTLTDYRWPAPIVLGLDIASDLTLLIEEYPVGAAAELGLLHDRVSARARRRGPGHLDRRRTTTCA